ncbi:MAG: 50S ribosomal protein L25 [bacterium]|jgi:large subunit ribosomal protein L25|nr:50S ribosomal protein L25 [bacterium]
MKRVDVLLRKREATGKGPARSARREGRIPGVIYGGGKDPVSVTVDRQVISKSLQKHGMSENVLVNMIFEGEEGVSELGLIRDTQHDPLTGVLDHLDFLRVKTDKKIKTAVAVVLVGNPAGARDGGILEQLLREVEIECFPLDIPESFQVDVTGLGLGDSIHISDVPIPETYTMLTPTDRALALVEVPRVASGTGEAGADAAKPQA